MYILICSSSLLMGIHCISWISLTSICYLVSCVTRVWYLVDAVYITARENTCIRKVLTRAQKSAVWLSGTSRFFFGASNFSFSLAKCPDSNSTEIETSWKRAKDVASSLLWIQSTPHNLREIEFQVKVIRS